MGFRFRKGINLGGGFRINLSKSGIGYSFGGKGFRYTKLDILKKQMVVIEKLILFMGQVYLGLKNMENQKIITNLCQKMIMVLTKLTNNIYIQ